MRATSIVIVEDEPLIAMDIQRRLTRLGYHVVAIVDSAEMALESVTQLQPELVVMDIQINGTVDGIQTADQIRQQFNLPVVYLTAHADTQS